jgi:hypothetical protein
MSPSICLTHHGAPPQVFGPPELDHSKQSLFFSSGLDLKIAPVHLLFIKKNDCSMQNVLWGSLASPKKLLQERCTEHTIY